MKQVPEVITPILANGGLAAQINTKKFINMRPMSMYSLSFIHPLTLKKERAKEYGAEALIECRVAIGLNKEIEARERDKNPGVLQDFNMKMFGDNLYFMFFGLINHPVTLVKMTMFPLTNTADRYPVTFGPPNILSTKDYTIMKTIRDWISNPYPCNEFFNVFIVKPQNIIEFSEVSN